MSRVVPDWLSAWASTDPERLVVSSASFQWTNRDLVAEADALALALSEAGVGEGGRVASLLADDAPAVALVAAARRLAAVLVPLNRRAAGAELEQQLAMAAPRVVVHDEAHADRARALAAVAAAEAVAVERILGRQLANRAPGAFRTDVDLDLPATIVFTSGTTGAPRGAVLSHGNHVASADAWAAVLEPRPGDRWLACLPLFHVAGLAIVMRSGRWGVPLEVATRFDASAVSEGIDAGMSHLSLVPAQLERLLTMRGGRATPPTLRAVLLGGGPIPADLLERARSAGLPVLATYGMTETSSGVAVGRLDVEPGIHPTALWPLPGADIRVGPTVDEDGIGQIHVRGPMVFRGYLGDDEATAERLRDGWLLTGDLGSLDDRGRLRIADRRDDLIICGGENVYPAEVEAVLIEHPSIIEAAVVGVNDPTWGAVPMAAIVLAPGAMVRDAALERHCRKRLAGYKVPASFHRVTALPRSESGKVLRRELRDVLVADRPALVGDGR